MGGRRAAKEGGRTWVGGMEGREEKRRRDGGRGKGGGREREEDEKQERGEERERGGGRGAEREEGWRDGKREVEGLKGRKIKETLTLVGVSFIFLSDWMTGDRSSIKQTERPMSFNLNVSPYVNSETLLLTPLTYKVKINKTTLF